MLRFSGGPLLLLAAWCSVTSSEKEVSIPVSDVGEGTRCDAKDGEAAKICFQCTRLSPLIAVQLTDCCTEDKAFDVCRRCVTNMGACEAEILSLQDSRENYWGPFDDDYEKYPDVDNDVEKRYGTTFLSSSSFGYPGKRYGRVYYGGRRGGGYGSFLYGSRSKRYGMLNIGGRRKGRYGYGFGKRGAEDIDDQEIEKRFGRLFMSRNRYGYGNKRFGSLFMGKSKSKFWK